MMIGRYGRISRCGTSLNVQYAVAVDKRWDVNATGNNGGILQHIDMEIAIAVL